MSLLDRLERKLPFLAFPHATIGIIAGQSFFYVAMMTGVLPPGRIDLFPQAVLEGEGWRLFTFLFDPPLSNPLFAIFAWYIFYLMGSALESHWGSFRYNLFLITGWAVTAAASFLAPYDMATNAFLAGSVFLAFAYLFPDFVLYIFFVLPVKVKWLALITWLGYAWRLITGNGMTRLMVLASVANFLIFFSRDIFRMLKSGRRTMAFQAKNVVRRDEPFHRCTVCGITDKTHPQMDFRYCPQCEGQHGYCQEHIFRHEHAKGRR